MNDQHILGFQHIVSLIHMTLDNLKVYWKEIGLEEEKKTNEFLNVEIFQFLQATEQQIENQRNECRENIQTLITNITEVSQQLDISIPTIKLQENRSLLDEIKLLQSHMNELQVTKEERLFKFNQLLAMLSEAYGEIGEEIPDKFNDLACDLSMKRLQLFEDQISTMAKEKQHRKEGIQKLQQDCQVLMAELKLDEYEFTEIDKALLAERYTLDYSLKTIESLSLRASELVAMKECNERENTLKELGGKIGLLWDRLKISDNVKEAFFEEIKGIGMDAIQACEDELKRLKWLKNEKLEDLIQEARESIQSIWDELNYSMESRALFTYMNIPISEYDDNILEKHEEELNKLEKHQDAFKPILKIIEKREAILIEREEYEEYLKDPERLLNRSGKRDTARLLREEKLYNHVTKELPRITELLRKSIPLYEEEFNTPFLYKGEAYLEQMEMIDREYTRRKEEEKAEKERRKKEEMEHEMTWGSTSKRASIGDRSKSIRINSKKALLITKSLSGRDFGKCQEEEINNNISPSREE